MRPRLVAKQHTDPDQPPAPTRCETCGGEEGWTWHDFGRVSRWYKQGCVPCGEARAHQREQGRLAERVAALGCPKRHRGYSFDRYIIQGAEESEEAHRARVQAASSDGPTLGVTTSAAGTFAALTEWSPPDGSVYIQGEVGSGKTTFAAALMERLVRAGGTALFVSEADLVAECRRRIGERSSAPHPLDSAKAARVLVLDDLGVATDGAKWSGELMEELVDHRYREEMPMVITSNLGIPALADRVGERVASRIADMTHGRRFVLVGNYRPPHR